MIRYRRSGHSTGTTPIPHGRFVRGLDRSTIAEVQRAPDLLRAIKQSVDHDRRPGRFLLTGPANMLTLPAVSESLAGRMEVVTLLPLAQAETRERRPTFLRKAFAGTLATPPEELIGHDLVRAVLTRGFPEMLRRTEAARMGSRLREGPHTARRS